MDRTVVLFLLLELTRIVSRFLWFSFLVNFSSWEIFCLLVGCNLSGFTWVKKALDLVLAAPFARSYIIGQENKRTNNRTILLVIKNNAVARYQGAVKVR